MKLLDVNILVEAHRADAPFHREVSEWLSEAMGEPPGVVVSDLVLSGFLRVVTHPRVFKEPTPLVRALEFVEALRSRRAVRVVAPGSKHWNIFTELLTRFDATGNHIPDAFHAALAMEYGYEWVSLDRGFSRYRDLKWIHPLD